LTVVPSADLGALGAHEGLPITYHWTRPSPMPLLLPWLGICGLLLLRPNRSGRSWWIWLPLAGVAGAALTLSQLITFVPSEVREFLGQLMGSFGFGLAAVWLLAPFLRRTRRVLTLAIAFLTLGLVGVLAQALAVGVGEFEIFFSSSVLLGVASLTLIAAMQMTAYCMRSQFSLVRFSIGTIAGIAIIWIGVFALALLILGGGPPWLEFFAAALFAAGTIYLAVFPFLLLSSFNSLFRERLMSLLHVLDTNDAPPPHFTGAPASCRLVEP
jgi:hypothetical protein